MVFLCQSRNLYFLIFGLSLGLYYFRNMGNMTLSGCFKEETFNLYIYITEELHNFPHLRNTLSYSKHPYVNGFM